MFTTIFDADGNPLDAKVEITNDAIVVHSRGGAFGKPNLRNPDHRAALTNIVQRLKQSGVADGATVWLDSRVAQNWPEPERVLVGSPDFGRSVEEIVTLIGKRAAAKGRPDGATGHGNSTKRVRIAVPNSSRHVLSQIVSGASKEGSKRLAASVQRRVQAWMVDDAIVSLKAGVPHNFKESRDYDVLLPSGERLPPKAVFGLALRHVIGEVAVPADFTAGWGAVCFEVIQHAGYPIIAKDDSIVSLAHERDDERSWAEGAPKRVAHLRRERAPGLADRKKKSFVAEHGRLFCERCELVPSEALGPFGDACIEVHHKTTAVAHMNEGTRTTLADAVPLCQLPPHRPS